MRWTGVTILSHINSLFWEDTYKHSTYIKFKKVVHDDDAWQLEITSRTVHGLCIG
jgi:hypothetical protein